MIMLGIVSLVFPRILTQIHAQARLFTIHNVPNKKVAIVFGAGLRRDGSPTRVLRDRVETAAELYFSGKVETLLLSGDNRFNQYNEPGAMRDYALQLGVPEKALVLDYAGISTYDTCYRAQHIFSIKEAVLVTQQFHLPRALYTCFALGIDAVGVPADRNVYRQITRTFWSIRELPATTNAMIEIHILHPLPVMGQPELISSLEVQ
jgi:vancomycin permeability regulator SanA